MKLSEAWDAVADDWVRWARAPGHDSYWQFHRDAFFELVPPAGSRTLDLGCGEGRVARDLHSRGHRVTGVDASARLIEAARAEDPSGDYRVADAAKLPVDDGSCDLVVAFMVLHDVDNLGAVVDEIARVLCGGGRLCAAIVHPLNSAGVFEGEDADSRFVVSASYLAQFRYDDRIERHGLRMHFHSMHRPLDAYSRAFEAAGLVMEAIREPPAAVHPVAPAARRWQRVPLFLDMRCAKR
jgi:SAM-dependent methyltransferase